MFENLLEMFLNQFLGQFIEGFDSQNLHIGIWSGEVTIQNVSLKADIIKMLELPLKICFSHIGKLKLNVPWKSLQSSPVEVNLQDLYLVISAEHPDVWQFIDFAGFKKKLEILEKFKESIIQNITNQSKAQNENQPGYITKLVLKIIDNIQLNVTNIHIRFEDTIKNEFAWGFTVKQIETYTCNSEWKKQFYDRSLKENKTIPLQKILSLVNIGAYWNQNENDFMNSKDKQYVLQKMEELIITQEDPKTHPKYSQFILLLNASGRLYQNTSGLFDKPEYSLTIELNTIDLAIENLQLQQIIRMAELFSLYQNRLKKQKKQKLLLSEKQIEDQKLIFLSLYEKILRSPDQSQKILTKDENDLFEQAVSNLSIEILCDSAKEIIKVVQKELAIKEAEDKKKKSGGWFSWGKKKENDLIDQKEREELSLFIDQLVDFQQVQNVMIPPDYVKYAVKFALKSGSVHILKQFESKREGIQLTYSGFDGNFEMMDSGMKLNLGLQYIGIDLLTEPIQNGIVMYSEQKRISFLEQTNNQKFIDFCFQTNPDHHKGYDNYIKLQTGSLKLIFNPIILVRISQFTDFQIKDDSLKNAAWDQVELAQDLAANQMAQSQLSPSKIFIDVSIKSTIVIVPIPDTTENWMINLGDVQIITPQTDQLDYDNFEVTLQDFTLKHYKKIEVCHDSIVKGIYLENLDGSYSVIQNFKVSIAAQILRGSSKAPITKPLLMLKGVLPELHLFVSPLIYGRILKIGDCFLEPVSEQEEVIKRQNRLSIEKAQTERTALMNNATKVGKIWKQGQLLTWSQYTAVLSGGYIYLFAKPKDQQPEFYFWIRNSDFEDVSEQDAGMANAFYVKNKYAETLIAFDKPKLAKDWKDAIEQLRTIPRVEKTEETAVQTQDVTQKKESRPMQFQFEVRGFGLHIQDDVFKDWLNVGISGLMASAQLLNGSIDLDLKLRDLYVTDSVQIYLNPLLKYIVKSDPDPQSKELISINVQQISNKDARYDKKNLIVNVTFGTLTLIAKPLVVAKLLVFVTPPQGNNEMQVYEVKDEEKRKRDQAKKELENNAQQQQINLESAKNIILMDVNVTLRSINVILVHRFTNLPLAQIDIQNTEIGLIKYVDEMQLKGSLGNLQLFDLTNYPNTLSKESEYTQIVPQQMIGVKYAQQSLLRVKLKLFTEGSNKIKDNVNIIINVEMSELIIHVMMQPVLRLLDYTLQQLLFALSNPKQTINPQEDMMEIQDDEIMQYQQQREQKKKTTILLSEEEQQYLTKQLSNPPAMRLNVIINNPQVILKPNQESQSAMVIDLGTIVVTNKRLKVTNRIDSKDVLLDGVWVDHFILNMKDIQIYQQNNNEKREFSLPFDFNVSVEIFGMSQQYQLQYPLLTFDEQLKIYSFTAPMILQMTHSDYMFLMKCLFHNIAFDDGFDNMIRKNNPQYFKAFLLQQQLQEQKQKEMLLAQKENPQLSFQLDMENFTVFLLKDIQPKPTPFLRMMLVMQRITFIKCQNGSAKVGLNIRDMEGSMFTTDQLGQYNELPFIGRMNINQVYSYEQVTNLTGLVRGRQGLMSNAGQALNLACCGLLSQGEQRIKIFKFEDAQQFRIDEAISYKLAFGLSMKVNGDKDMNVDLSDFKLQVHAGPLFDVLALIAMDDPNLNPPSGKYVQQQQILQNNQLQQQINEPIQQQQQQQQGSLKIKVNLRNVITCIPTKVEQNILTIKGIFDINLVMAPKKTLEQVRKEINENNIQELQWEKLNETMLLEAKLQKLEIFLCKSYDLSKKEDFKQVKKREILNPIDFEVSYSQSSVIQKHMLGFTDLQAIIGKISPVQLKVSFKDLVTIKDGLNYQLSQMPKQEEKKEEVNKNQNNELSKLDASHLNNLQVREMRIDFRIAGTKVIVLNDMGNSFTPLFEYEMEEIIAQLDQNNIFLKIKVELPFRLSNFNPLCTKWEPIIEKTGFVVEIYQSQIRGLGGQTNNLITVEQMEDYDNFNITLSTNCIQTILRALKIMQIMFKKVDDDNHQSISKSFVQVEDDKSQSEENLVQVSPYAIRNLTGYPLIVECIDNQKIPISQVAVNQQQNLILEEENEILSINKQKRVNITIKMGDKQFPIKLIDFEKNKSKSYQYDDKNIYCTVKLDQVTNQKILTVSSSIIIVNKTNKNVIIQLNDQKNSQTLKLTSGKSEQEITHMTPVPILFQDTKISIRTNEFPQYSDEISLESLIRQKDQVHEIQTRDGLCFMIKIYEDKELKNKLKIELQTPYRITNSLPKDIYIQMLNQNKETTYTRKLAAGQSIEDYQHFQSKQTYLRILLQGYYWSDEYKLYSGDENKKNKEDCISNITIFDAYNCKTSLLVYEPWRQSDYDKTTREFVIHCKGYIMNQTGLQLGYFTNDKKKDLMPVGGQESINSGDQIDRNMIFISQDSGNLLTLTHQSALSKVSLFPIEITTIGEPQIDVIRNDDEGDQSVLVQTFIGAKIDLQQCNSKYSLFNKVIALEPRFILVNNSDKTIIVTNNNWQYFQTVESNFRKIYNIQYEQKNNIRDAQQLINLRLDDDKYEFPGKINISAIGIVYFQMKNRTDEKDKLYFSCDTRKEGSSIYVIFTHIPKDKAPYKVQLNADNFELKLFELGVTLNDQNPETYFAWDDPQQLQKFLSAELCVKDDPFSDYSPFKYKLYPDYIGLFKVYAFRPKKGSKAPIIHVALIILPEGNQKQVKISIATEEQIKLSKSKPKQDFLKQAKEKIDQGIGFNEDEETDRQSQSLSLSRQSTMNEGDKIENRINLKLTSISLSMVHNSDSKKRPSEFFHFTFRNLEFVRIVTDISEVYQLRVQYVNFDHNAQFFVSFPVVMTPQKYTIYNPVQKQIKEQKQNDQSQQSLQIKQQQNEPPINEKYFFNVMIMKDAKVSDITLLQNVTLEIDPFEIKIEQLFIMNLLEYVWAITEYQKNIENFEKSQQNSFYSQKQSEVLQKQEQEEEKQIERKNTDQYQPESFILVSEQWKIKKLPDAQLATYISEVILSPISINLTFQISGKADLQIVQQSAIISSIAQALGVALSDIDNAPIFFQGQKLENCFDTLDGLNNKLVAKYKSDLIGQIGKLVGSLSIIGNPIGLFNNVSTGFKDFVDKPAEGLTKGPLEAGLGLAQGAGSLVSHTISGAFNSVNKIAGSVGSGLANLSMDDEYLKKREKMKMKKPKHLGQGFGQGAESIMTGITDGLTGVFLKPFKGAKEGGLGGFFKGTAQGLAGLIIKPVTGVFDGISQAAAGVQNTMSYFDDKPNSNRARNVRPVYSMDGYLTDFNQIDGEGFAMIHFIKNGQLMNDRFEKAFLLVPDIKEPENKYMFVITIENFIYMSFKTKKKVWILSTNDITHVETLPSGIKIQVNKPQKQLKNKYITQVIVGNDQKDALYQIMYQVLQINKNIEN